MRKLLYVLIMIFAVFATACDDDSDDVAELKIISSTFDMDVTGGGGTIEVSAPGTISAISTSDWCTTSVSGSIIYVTVTVNDDLFGRTALVTISSLGQELSVPVTQPGVVFSVASSALALDWQEGSTISTTLSSPFEVSADSDSDWLGCSVSGTTIIISALSDNESFVETRSGTITLTSAGIPRKVTVTQALRYYLYEDFIGTWTIYYNNGTSDTSRTVTLSEDVSGTTYTLAGLSFAFTVNYNSDGTMEILGNQIVGSYLGINVYLHARTSTSYFANASVGLISEFDHSSSDVVVNWVDNGVWGSATGFGYFVTIGSVYSLGGYYNCTMTKN